MVNRPHINRQRGPKFGESPDLTRRMMNRNNHASFVDIANALPKTKAGRQIMQILSGEEINIGELRNSLLQEQEKNSKPKKLLPAREEARQKRLKAINKALEALR